MATKRSFGTALTSTEQVIYTVPDYREAHWVLLYITNTSGSNGNVTVSYYDDSETATLPILSGYTITAKEFFNIGGEFNEFIYMDTGDQIKASATQDMTMLVSIIEYNSNR
jgi:hypothetical protein